MKIYAIIVTYNAMRRNWADRCLKSLQNSTTDGTREYIPSHYPDAVWLPQSHNLGFGQANNVGICYVLNHHADYVLLLNQDASLHPDALVHLTKACDGKSLLSPIQQNGNGTALDKMFKNTLRLAENQLLDDLLLGKVLHETYDTGRFAAACWFIPSDIIKTVGGFNPLFFHYGEDDNYYFRTQYYNYKTRIVSRAIMYHDRAEHGNIKLFNHNYLRRELLNIACNINNSFIQCIAKWGNQLISCYYNYTKIHYRPGSFMVEMLWLALHFKSVYKSRKKEKQKGLTWLFH